MVVPLRSFDDAKSRLAGVLDPDVRAALARAMAERVLAAAGPWPVRVVTDDPEVATWAARRDVEVVAGGAGLDHSVTTAVSRLAAAGVRRVVVAHADLPRARTLAPFAGPGLVIAPDRHADGSNVVAVPTDADFRFAYGPGSYARHLAEARRLGLAVTIVDDPDLAWDVDHPDDLAGLPADLAPLVRAR